MVVLRGIMVSEWSVRDVVLSVPRQAEAPFRVLVDKIEIISKRHYSSLDCLRCLRTTISRTLARIPAVVVVSVTVVQNP